jgi:segregation and condensation protein B
MDNIKEIKSAIEGILFVNGDGINIKKLSNILDLPVAKIRGIVQEMKLFYEMEERGIMLIETGNELQLVSKPHLNTYLEKLAGTSKSRGLSNATLEVLSIIVYKQPVTRSQIDAVRGVKSEKPLMTLLGKDLIEEKGRLDAIGKPIIYGTTDFFLKCFGLKSIKELPSLETFQDFNFLMK